jgi:Ser/Thr protein kinase RdoA (MazF antagonist)
MEAAERFKPNGRIVGVQEYGGGNVHDTFLVTLDAEEPHFILQRMNTSVFRKPEEVMENMRLVTEHVLHRLESVPLSSGRRFELPRVLPTAEGSDYWLSGDGSFWRAMSFIRGTESSDTIRDESHAGEVGWALGPFNNLISDLPVERLFDTLEGFHETPRYLRRFDDVLSRAPSIHSPETDYCLAFVNRRRAFAGAIEEARSRGELSPRPIHGDPKVSNVLMDTSTGRAVSLIDLDTVKPGLVHYDIGDCLRSCCNPLGEETARWESVGFDTDLCRIILKGYLSEAKAFFTSCDYEYLFDAVRLIAFELGLRFFTDYLEGNVYFKVRYPEHNLARALVQFKLAESVELQEGAIRAIIRDLRGYR